MRVVFIPYRCWTEDRARSHAYVRAWWTDHGFTVVEGEGPRVGVFNVAAAFNEAAAAGGAWTTGLFTGAEIVPEDAAQATRAFERAEASGRLVHAARRFGRLDRAATEEVFAGRAPTYESCEYRPDKPFRGLKTVPRYLFDAVHGFDERFEGYHGEDLAFNRACRTLAGEDWLDGYAVHLWHAENRGATEVAYRDANEARVRAYYRASKSRSTMRRYLEVAHP